MIENFIFYGLIILLTANIINKGLSQKGMNRFIKGDDA